MHECKNCGKEQETHYLCDACWLEAVDKLIRTNKVQDEAEAYDMLYDVELESWYASKGY